MKKRSISFIFLLILILIGLGLKTEGSKKDGDTWIPYEQQQICEEIGAEYGVCPELLEAIIEAESSGKPRVTNGSCVGLMQINMDVHQERAKRLGVTDIYDERQNILMGTDILMELAEKYEDLPTTLMAYNGQSHPAERVENGEISEYAWKIMDRSEQLERLHGK